MTRLDRRRLHHHANHVVSHTTRVFGSLTAIALAVVVVVLWALGLLYDVSWMRLITSMTTVVTFVMVFIIQSTQNRESRAMQTKLDALLIADERLDERQFLGLEQQPDATIQDVQTEVHGFDPTDTGGTSGDGAPSAAPTGPESVRESAGRTRT
jgi:low affinity Fe/Cu permease